VVGFTTGSRGEVPGKRKPVIREQQQSNNNNNNNIILKSQAIQNSDSTRF
jgi:hypothetical protein